MKIQPFQDHHFRTPFLNMGLQIFQHLTIAKKINKCTSFVKCYTPGTKLYIRQPPQKLEAQKVNSEASHAAGSDSDNRQACPVKATSCRNRHPMPHPYKCNKNKDIYHNTRYESDSETEEFQITKHLHIGSIELHPQPNITTYDLEDVESDIELEHSLTTHWDEQS